jgi:hypothetical protein
VLKFSALFKKKLAYFLGLVRIVASLKSPIGSLSILLTVVFQLLLIWVGIKMLLPPNMPLAVVGGTLEVLGIFMMHLVDRR